MVGSRACGGCDSGAVRLCFFISKVRKRERIQVGLSDFECAIVFICVRRVLFDFFFVFFFSSDQNGEREWENKIPSKSLT